MLYVDKMQHNVKVTLRQCRIKCERVANVPDRDALNIIFSCQDFNTNLVENSFIGHVSTLIHILNV